MITITFEPNTPDQAELVGRFLKTYMAGDAAPATAEDSPAKKVKAAKPAPVAEQAPQTPASPAPRAQVVTLVEVRAKLAALGHEGKADAVKAMLAARGVQKLSEVPAEQLAEVLAEAEGL